MLKYQEARDCAHSTIILKYVSNNKTRGFRLYSTTSGKEPFSVHCVHHNESNEITDHSYDLRTSTINDYSQNQIRAIFKPRNFITLFTSAISWALHRNTFFYSFNSVKDRRQDHLKANELHREGHAGTNV